MMDADADADADVDASPIDPTAILDADSSTSASHTGATLGVPATPATATAAHRPLSSAAARFSRYLRTARRRRRAREDAGGYDATNPPLPLAPHTALREGEAE